MREKNFHAEAQGGGGWDVKPLRAFLRPRTVRGRPDAQLLSVTREAGVIVRNVSSKEENHNYIPDDLSNYKFVGKDQFVINKMKAWQGSYGVSPCDGLVSPAYYVYDLSFPCKEFFNIAIRSKAYVPYFQRYSKGIRVDQWDLTPEALKAIPFAFPSLPEQEAIVRYLDAETGRIDKAIAAEEKMIALLQERREIVINEAVGGGGDFDSETLRRRGWEVRRLKSLLRPHKKLVGKRCNEYDLLSLTLRGIVKRDIDNPDGKFPASFETYQEVNPGEFIFCMFDNEETPRAVGLSNLRGMITGAYDVMSLIDDGISPEFLNYYFLWIDDGKRLKPLYKGLRKSVPTDSFLACKIPLPPLPEQEEIVKRLDAETGKIDRAIEVKRRQVELLRERRQIIIDEAVTGKVKVA